MSENTAVFKQNTVPFSVSDKRVKCLCVVAVIVAEILHFVISYNVVHFVIASAKRAAKRLAKRALLTNVYVYRKGRTEAKVKATHTYSGLTKIRRLAKAEAEIPWSNMWTTGMGEGILGWRVM